MARTQAAPVESVGKVVSRVIEALLLLAGDHGLEAATDDAIDDDPGDEQHAEHDRARMETQPPRQRQSWRRLGHAGSRVATSR